MKTGRFCVFLSCALAMAGCMTISDAQKAQRAVAPKGDGTESKESLPKFDLTDYSLKELVEFAMTNRPSVVSAALAVEDARLALREIAADAPLVSYSPWTSPHLDISGGYAAASEQGKHLHWATEGGASAGLSLQILLYDFGRNEARASEQVERVIEAEHAFIREGYTVFEEVATAYFNMLESDAYLDVAITNETEFALHLRQAEEMLAAGERQRLDVVRARAELYQAKQDTIAKSNAVVTAGAELMRALGVDASRGTRNEVYPPSGNAIGEMTRGFARTTYGVDAAFHLARTNAPTVAISRARLRAASHAVDRAIADLLPSVQASVSLSWADPLWVWHWGVDAAQSLFQGFRKTTAVDRAVVQMHGAAADVDDVEQQLSLEIEQEIAVRDNAGKAWETARMTVAAAREEFELAKARYLEGDASRVDFTDAMTGYTLALGQRITAFYAGQRAEAKLFATTGTMPKYHEEVIRRK